MDAERTRRFRRDAELLRVLANESRLAIVDRLSRGECCVCDLVALIGSDQSTVSKHLALLRRSGVVEGERRGNHIYYHLLTPCVLSVLSCAARAKDEREARYASDATGEAKMSGYTANTAEARASEADAIGTSADAATTQKDGG
jgi:DNA-binding transcriptional ArsR family regulator